MNGVRCIDRSREFLISSNRSVSPLHFSYHILWYVPCAGPLFNSRPQRPHWSARTERGGAGSKSSMRVYCASLWSRKKKPSRKRDKDISGSPSGVGTLAGKSGADCCCISSPECICAGLVVVLPGCDVHLFTATPPVIYTRCMGDERNSIRIHICVSLCVCVDIDSPYIYRFCLTAPLFWLFRWLDWDIFVSRLHNLTMSTVLVFLCGVLEPPFF